MKKKSLDILDLALRIGLGILVLTFILYPFFSVFKTAFYKDGVFDIGEFRSLKNTSYLIKNSITTGIYTTLLTTIFSLSLGIYYYMAKDRTRKIIMGILMLTIISPPFVSSLAYIRLFGRRGLISYGLLGLKISPYGQLGIVLMQSLGFTSMNAILYIGFLSSLDKSLIESARSLGGKTSNIIKDVILGTSKPAILVIMLLSFIRSLSDFSTPRIIGGAFNVLATEAYLSVIAKGNIRRASSISVILFIPAIIIFLIYIYSYKSLSLSTSTGAKDSRPKIERQGFFYRLISLIAVFFMVWILIQYSSIILSAFTDYRKGKIYFTLDHFRESKKYISDTFIRSIFVSLLAGIVSSFLGILIQYYSLIRNSKFMKLIDFIGTMPYIVPGTFFGIGYILAFNKKPLELTGTFLIVCLNLIFRQLPFSSKIAYSSLSQISSDSINSIKDLGGHNLNVIKDLVLPLSRPGFYVSFINGFTSTMTTIGSVIFLVYPRQKLATMVMFDVIESGKYGVGSVIAFLIILICLFVNISYYLIIERREAKNVLRS